MSAPEVERERASTLNDTSPPPKRPGSAPARSIRPVMMRLHFYAGILIAPFILIAAVSGGLYAVAPSLEQLVYREYLHVDSTGPALPVADQVRAAQQVRPDLTVAAVRPAPEPGDTTRVLFSDPGLGESERRAVFVDPATAHPVGEQTVYGSSSALPLRTWISQLHRHLHLGEPGRIYSELAASWMWVVALGGVYLWWDRYRKVRQRNGSEARLLTVDRSTSERARTSSWHGVVGIWIAVGLVFLSATGLTWSKYAGENVSELRTALSWTTPQIDNTLGAPAAAAPGGHAEHGGHGVASGNGADLVAANVTRIDSVLATARENGVDGAVEASIPATSTTAFTVAQTRQPWVFATDSLAVDGASGQVTDVLRFSTWPLAAKLTSWGIQLHMGLQFGLLNQLALAALAVALVTVIVRGYLMWWRRRPTRGSDWAVGRPPLRGALRQVRPALAIGLAAGAAAVGWFVPLLGLSLIAFLLVDVLVGLRARHRRRT
ncbi:PepSY domain-containing protein [Rhodococcus spelaei]|uniref:PepSY domain-containing protein n=1 Tax=Rhodococcus spelaei TaxID=2546320 RepID=A0A541BPB1_9NOCA|nr:PepSY domain-containing protein [Rhodococcus spelaei]TQF74078.1 PepSY domain-containing protein [Rhodococcus spelaei]